MNRNAVEKASPKKRPESQKKKILVERAKELAQPLIYEIQEERGVDVVEFMLSYGRYAFESERVAEVLPVTDYTPIPCTPEFVVGVMNLRGTLLTLIDLRRFCDLPILGLTNLNRLIVAEEGDIRVGILVDQILGMRQIPSREIRKTHAIGGEKNDFVKGITSEPLVLLDLERILKDPRLIVNQEVEI